jgi:hypothetical protein
MTSLFAEVDNLGLSTAEQAEFEDTLSQLYLSSMILVGRNMGFIVRVQQGLAKMHVVHLLRICLAVRIILLSCAMVIS